MPGIYIHIPFCKAKCRYCDFTSYPGKIGFSDAYMACVIREMQFRAKDLEKYEFGTVYFGGGTPSVVDPKWIVGCMNEIRKEYKLADGAEVTLELNPGTVDAEKIAAYKYAGVNRFSVGLQSANDKLLRDIGRIHTAKDFEAACSLLKGENFNADIMIGLKGQTLDDIKNSIALAARCGASHISVYALTPEEGTPIYTEEYLNGDLPDQDEVADMYAQSVGILAEHGYKRYEVSNFAKPGFESRHNMNYWKRGEYIGFGVSASSFMAGRRFTNTPDLDEYTKCILSSHYPVVDDEKISEKDSRFEKVMLALRTADGLDIAEYRSDFGSEFVVDFFDALSKNKEYLDFDGRRVRIKDEFLYVQNQILCDFIE